VAGYTYRRYSELAEGSSQVRAAVVNAACCRRGRGVRHRSIAARSRREDRWPHQGVTARRCHRSVIGSRLPRRRMGPAEPLVLRMLAERIAHAPLSRRLRPQEPAPRAERLHRARHARSTSAWPGPDHDRATRAEFTSPPATRCGHRSFEKKDAETRCGTTRVQELKVPETSESKPCARTWQRGGRRKIKPCGQQCRSVPATRAPRPSAPCSRPHITQWGASQVPPFGPRQRDTLVVHLGMSGQLLRVKS